LRLFADGHELTSAQRAPLVGVALARADRMWLSMRGAAEYYGGRWAQMWNDGVGDLIRRRRAWQVDRLDECRTALD
jgi:hypothetical protein